MSARVGEAPRILVVGKGAVGGRAFHYLANAETPSVLHLLGRDEVTTRQVANTARFSAAQRGKLPEVSWGIANVYVPGQLAEVIDRFRPDVVLLAVSRQTWSYLYRIPPHKRAALEPARFGPWLPMHLSPVRAAMREIRSSGQSPHVVNAAFPDSVHPALAAEGLAPQVGIGNIGLNVPALELGAAQVLDVSYDDVAVTLVGHHSASTRLRRPDFAGSVEFRVTVDGKDATDQVDFDILRATLSEEFDRIPGVPGEANVAAAAAGAVEALAHGRDLRFHAPGVLGRTGGWPVRHSEGALTIDLPDSLPESVAEATNLAGQREDGITRIDETGTAHFEDWALEIMRDVLGFDHAQIALTDVDAAADELAARVHKYVAE